MPLIAHDSHKSFDAENRLISVTVNSQTIQFVYNGDGNLTKKINPDDSKTVYVGGVYEVDKTSLCSARVCDPVEQVFVIQTKPRIHFHLGL